MPSSHPIVTLLTDFGLEDTYIGVVKGVILGLAPHATLVDVTHAVPPQDVPAGAYHLSNAWAHFPQGTIHLVIVDPTVGSTRHAVAVRAQGHVFLAPDNGLLTPVLSGEWTAVVLPLSRPETGRSASATFHGRDVFAPAAGRLARGEPLESLGPSIATLVRLSTDTPQLSGSKIHATAIHIDHFGNVILDATSDALMGLGRVNGLEALVQARTGVVRDTRFVTHYAAAGNKMCVLINSDGRLEIALPGGSAARALGAERGDLIVLTLPEPEPRT